MGSVDPPFGSDEFLNAITLRAVVSGKDKVAMMLSPGQVEVVVYALRELMLLPQADIKVPDTLPELARTLLADIAAAAGVDYRPVTGPVLDS
jgi:hypothetical protein